MSHSEITSFFISSLCSVLQVVWPARIYNYLNYENLKQQFSECHHLSYGRCLSDFFISILVLCNLFMQQIFCHLAYISGFFITKFYRYVKVMK